MLHRTIILILTIVLLTACAIKVRESPKCWEYSKSKACNDIDTPRKIAIFLDGTSNTASSHTNISKLHKLVTLQNKPEIRTYYISGVGTEVDKLITGNIVGRGFDERVKLAYQYIAQNYRKDRKDGKDGEDQIYLFGFSRGSYSARVLAGLIYVADIPDFSEIKDTKEQRRLIDKIYREYKGNGSAQEKRLLINRIEGYMPASTDTKIAYMGLFDTVSALGYDPRGEFKIKDLNSDYEDQICNIEKVSHAMSIDDNRAHSFTPMPMKISAIASGCEGIKLDEDDEKTTQKITDKINEVITEVWFSGAHSDVGGGYEDSDLSGVSLNWMIRQIQEDKNLKTLLPKDASVPEDVYGISHIGEYSIGFDPLFPGLVYINRNRNIPAYVEYHMHRGFTKPVIHSSVIARRARVPRTYREFDYSPIVKTEERSRPNTVRALKHRLPVTISEDEQAPLTNYARCFTSKEVDPPLMGNPDSYDKRVLIYKEDLFSPCFEINEPELYPPEHY